MIISIKKCDAGGQYSRCKNRITMEQFPTLEKPGDNNLLRFCAKSWLYDGGGGGGSIH